ncbi:ATP-binding protein [soil metagenome]
MRAVRRQLEPVLAKAARAFSDVVLTGPRSAGKTCLLRHLFPRASYRLLEDPAVLARVRSDPDAFLDELELPAILDEVQNVPEIFAHVRARIDREPRKTGRWFLTGSQEAGLMKGVTESMAGRAAMLQLLPMSVAESSKVTLLRGGFPEVLARPRAATLWFDAYLQTYLERDVRGITAVHDLALFRRFIALVASRHGQVLNKTDLAAPLGLSIPSIGRWLDILEATQQIMLVPPYFETVGKRLIKSPKLYVADSGLACHLLGIRTETELTRSPFYGAVFEGWVASEIAKTQLHAGRRRELYYFRDQQGLEVDFVVPTGGRSALLVEAKAGKTVRPQDATAVRRLMEAMEATGLRTRGVVVHRGANTDAGHALAPGITAVTLDELLALL